MFDEIKNQQYESNEIEKRIAVNKYSQRSQR